MMGGDQQVFITFLYASPEIGMRSRLWRLLRELNPGSGLPWMLGGDFNVIGNYGERQGGSQRRYGVCSKFGEFMFDTGLIDMGFSEVFYLQKLDSDHLLILFMFGDQQEPARNKPFRYIDAWNDYPDFPNLLMNSWRNDRDIYKILDFQAKSSKWNKELKFMQLLSQNLFNERMVSNTENERCTFVMGMMLFDLWCVIFHWKRGYLEIGESDSVGVDPKVVLPKWVEENQASFVPDRQITDIILAQEIIHSMKRRGRIGWMAIKVDLEKAYDHPCRHRFFGVGILRIPLSLREEKVVSEDWKVIHLSKEGPGLSHLFFVDDLVLFAKASMIKGVLDSTRQAISQRFGFEEVKDLGKYLGVPLLHNRVTKDTYSYLIDRLTQRLSGWMTKCLTLAGRITLAKATLQAIPVYVMQSTWLPKDCVLKWKRLLEDLFGVQTMEQVHQDPRLRVLPSCTWNWGKLSSLLPEHVLQRIFVVQPPQDYLGPDTPGAVMEDVDHILRHCSMARNMWVRVIKTDKLNEFMTLPYKIWIERNLRVAEMYAQMNVNWDIRFAVYCWHIWKQRCNILFDPNYVEREEFIYRCDSFVDKVMNANVSNANPSPSMSRNILSWTRPPTGWIKGNLDGAVRTCNNMAVVGGILRNSKGEWVFGFTRSIGRCSILIAELWGVHDLLLHTWRLGIRHIELETDNLEVMKICNFSSDALVGVLWSLKSMNYSNLNDHKGITYVVSRIWLRIGWLL
ncbi:hypothetical protein F3Y22_tig00110206pilonHSYRG00050 [Hibiscus syriacus]|uniref:RNase H type-1 domain-containing protein n=1 Tax=Hibiscus syriacus TaxID=106335 RepID=A0A6A3B9H1_HIBSY|nr:hypothetical protein F3Y22_tig00110206pilonHSYRG00050 [Hibiscus syriacus]